MRIRALSPLFAGDGIRLNARRTGEDMALWTAGDAGGMAVQATAWMEDEA